MLVKELPELVDGVVAGVIKDNLRANTNPRLAPRTADEADSTDVLGSAEAAFVDPALPGALCPRQARPPCPVLGR